MTALAAAPSLFDALGGEPTLDDAVAGVWEGLTAHKVVDCLVCGEPMKPEYGAMGGHCQSCGSTLC